MYALVETGGKQYKVAAGDTVVVEKIDAQVGDTVELDRVLMISDENGVKIGQPVVDGVSVKATVVDQGKSRKVLVFKYRAKQRYRRKVGHRQSFTRLRIDEINA